MTRHGSHPPPPIFWPWVLCFWFLQHAHVFLRAKISARPQPPFPHPFLYSGSQAEEDEPLSEQLGIGPESPEDLKKRLASLVKRSKVMLFMKGNPDAPRCGFSRTAVEMLRGASIDFDSFDILEDEAVRQGLKEFSKWPTYPQLYVNGSLVGGLDVLKELEEDGELDEALQG